MSVFQSNAILMSSNKVLGKQRMVLVCREKAREAARLSDDTARHFSRTRQSYKLYINSAVRTEPVSRVRRPACVQPWQRRWDDNCCRLHGGCSCRWLIASLPSYFSPCIFHCWQMLESVSLHCGVLSCSCCVVESVFVDFLKRLCCM